MIDPRTLVLNNTFEPLQFTGARRALVMVILGKAEPLESDGFYARTVTRSYRLPTVIRLHRYIRRPNQFGVPFSKKNVFRRDNFSCQYCGSQEKELTIDHVIPKSLGGTSDWENVVTACRACNLKKGNKSLSLTGLKLNKTPGKPRFLIYPSAIPAHHPKSHEESWAKYLSFSKW